MALGKKKIKNVKRKKTKQKVVYCAWKFTTYFWKKKRWYDEIDLEEEDKTTGQ